MSLNFVRIFALSLSTTSHSPGWYSPIYSTVTISICFFSSSVQGYDIAHRSYDTSWQIVFWIDNVLKNIKMCTLVAISFGRAPTHVPWWAYPWIDRPFRVEYVRYPLRRVAFLWRMGLSLIHSIQSILSDFSSIIFFSSALSSSFSPLLDGLNIKRTFLPTDLTTNHKIEKC